MLPPQLYRRYEMIRSKRGTALAQTTSGIGLFVCARLIRAMGGRIWATSRPQGGAEFGFALRMMGEDD